LVAIATELCFNSAMPSSTHLRAAVAAVAPVVDSIDNPAARSANPDVLALRAMGAKVTGPRMRVMQALRLASTPPSHRELLDALQGDHGEQIDRVTVYRVLDWLVSMSLAHKSADAQGVFRFSPALAGDHAAHVHFRCNLCGGVFCLKDAPPARPRLPKGFRLTQISVDIQGECARCAR
jgi:Fur family transcriptional regulator, ferric uptake regulator